MIKGEISHNEQCLLLRQCFQNSLRYKMKKNWRVCLGKCVNYREAARFSTKKTFSIDYSE